MPKLRHDNDDSSSSTGLVVTKERVKIGALLAMNALLLGGVFRSNDTNTLRYNPASSQELRRNIHVGVGTASDGASKDGTSTRIQDKIPGNIVKEKQTSSETNAAAADPADSSQASDPEAATSINNVDPSEALKFMKLNAEKMKMKQQSQIAEATREATKKESSKLKATSSATTSNLQLPTKINDKSILDWAQKATNCEFFLDQNEKCFALLQHRINAAFVQQKHDTAKPRRWIFLGDSNMALLLQQSPQLSQLLLESTANPQESCFVCTTHLHSRCFLNKWFGLPPIVPNDFNRIIAQEKDYVSGNYMQWKPPRHDLGEGPLDYGKDNYNCHDDARAISQYRICGKESADCTATQYPIDGGYVAVEYTRDVTVQGRRIPTSQENMARFLQDKFAWAKAPVCVVSAGLNDLAVPTATLRTYATNLQWYLMLLKEPCLHIVFLQNTAPVLKDDQDPSLNHLWGIKPRLPQTWETVAQLNARSLEAIDALVQDNPQLASKITIINVYAASLQRQQSFREESHSSPIMDHLAMPSDWYQDLGVWFSHVMQNM